MQGNVHHQEENFCSEITFALSLCQLSMYNNITIRHYGFAKNVMLQSYLEGSTNLWLISVDKHFMYDPG